MNKNVVIEFVSQLSEEDLKWASQRIIERRSGDLPEFLEFVSRHKGMDNIFSSARTADEIFDFCDEAQEVIQRECKKRGINIKWQAV